MKKSEETKPQKKPLLVKLNKLFLMEEKMIARCGGHNCPLKKTCYRFLIESSDDKSAWTQSMYSPLHNNCRNYWAIRVEDKSQDDHARMLNSMIKRLNLIDQIKEKEKNRKDSPKI